MAGRSRLVSSSVPCWTLSPVETGQFCDGRLRPDQAMSTVNAAASQYDLSEYELMLDRLKAFGQGAITGRRAHEMARQDR